MKFYFFKFEIVCDGLSYFFKALGINLSRPKQNNNFFFSDLCGSNLTSGTLSVTLSLCRIENGTLTVVRGRNHPQCSRERRGEVLQGIRPNYKHQHERQLRIRGKILSLDLDSVNKFSVPKRHSFVHC